MPSQSPCSLALLERYMEALEGYARAWCAIESIRDPEEHPEAKTIDDWVTRAMLELCEARAKYKRRPSHKPFWVETRTGLAS